MRRRVMWIIGAGVAAVALLAGFRGGGCGRHGGGHHGGMHDPERVSRYVNAKVDTHLDELNATGEQRARVRELTNSLLADGMKLKEEQRAVRTELLRQWDSERPDRDAVHALVDQRVDAFRGFAHRVADAVLEVHALFTPEQRKQVSAELHEKMGR